MRALFFVALLMGAMGCSSAAEPASVNDASAPDVSKQETASDAVADAWDGNKSTTCASTFGAALTNAFGRLDGEVVAIVGPQDTQCALPNDDHVTVQLAMNGAVYRVVVNVASTRGTDLRVRHAVLDHALPMPAWALGWHTDVTLDYPTTLDAHTTTMGMFTPYEMTPLVKRITDAIPLGAKVSAYSWSSGGASSHMVHRNERNPQGDGALVVNADTATPKWLLFHFDGQTF